MLLSLARFRAKLSPLTTAAAAVVVLTLTLAACGGGGGGGGGGGATGPGILPDTPPSPEARVNLSAPNPSDGVDYTTAIEYKSNPGLGVANAAAAYQRGYWGQGATVALLDTGVRRTHNDLAANIVGGLGLLLGNPGITTTTNAPDEDDGNGTFVAGIIGGMRDGERFHGVAPSVKIMPLKPDLRGNAGKSQESFLRLFRYAAENNVNILHNGFNLQPNFNLQGIYVLEEREGLSLMGGRVTASIQLMPGLEPYLSSPFGAESRDYVASLVSPLAGRDIVVVTPNDDAWHSGGSQLVVGGFRLRPFFGGSPTPFPLHSAPPEEVIRNFEITAVVSVHFDGNGTTTIALDAPIRLFNPLTFTVNGRRTVVRADPNSPGGLALAPIYHPELRGKWLIVGAVDSTMGISYDSGGCGYKSKYWCLVAPSGKGISISLRTVNAGTPNVSVAVVTTFFYSTLTSAGVGSDTDITVGEFNDIDSAAAAAHVSGALALLKSRFPNMPMSVLVHILLSTATDLGARGVDDVYGHGLLNIARAITLQGNASFVLPPLPTLAPQVPGYPAVALNTSDGRNYRDTEFRRNYGLGAINADAAYQRDYWGQGVTVAVVDSGVRGSHANLSANVLRNLARRFDSFGNAWRGGALTDPFTIISGRDIGSHGTGVAGVIAGVRNGSSAYGHGVAPSAKVLPLRFSENNLVTINRIWGRITTFPLRGDDDAAFRYAVNNNVQIINNSWGSGFTYYGHYDNDTDATLAFEGPILPPLWQVPGLLDSFRRNIETKANIFRNEDVAVVWAAGNDGWNSETSTPYIRTYEVPSYTTFYTTPRQRTSYTPAQLVSNFVAHEVFSGNTVVIPLADGARVTVNGIAANVSGFEPDGVGDYALAPMLFPSLRGKWLAVVATDDDNEIARFSNGCGRIAKYWCLAAPGVDITTAYAQGDTWRYRANGTSFSAPHVSGALALLKSRFKDMPMSVLIHILLSTATDLGEAGVDNVYGHGLVNISAAITVQSNSSIVLSQTPQLQPTVSGWPLNPSDGNDYRTPEFNRNWALGAMNADAAYQRGYWGQGVTVAVIDTGIIAHSEITGRIAPGLPRQNATTSLQLKSGTFAAGVIGAANDGVGLHGIAPSVHLMPLFRFRRLDVIDIVRRRIPEPSLATAAFRHAATSNVHIINSAWDSTNVRWWYRGSYRNDRSRDVVFFGPALNRLMDTPGAFWPLSYQSGDATKLRDYLREYADALADRDVAAIWAAGNNSWHSGASVRVCSSNEPDDSIALDLCLEQGINNGKQSYRTPEYLISNFVIERRSPDATVTLSRSDNVLTVRRNLGDVTTTAVYTISAFQPNGVNAYAWGPHYHPELLGKWLAVVAVDESSVIAGFSNGCGEARDWCLAAPGVSIYTIDENDGYTVRSGTSFAASHVSGALALMKSRLQNMPMSVLIAILLSTATDLGDAGVDDVYGHGLVNVSAAITAQNGAQVVTRNSGVLLRDAKTQLPPSFAAFAQRAGEVRAAVRYLDGFYYDAPLKNLLQTNKAKNTPLNFAAEVFPHPGPLPRAGEGVKNGAFAFAEDGELREVGLRGGMFQVRHNWHSAPSLWNRVGGVSTRPFYASDKGNSGEMRFNFGAHLAMFAARGKEDTSRYRQFGLSWRRDFSQTGMALSFSRIDEDDTLLGGKFGGAMPLTGGGRTTQTGIAAYYKLGASEIWRAYANYRRADINANLGGIVH